MTLHNRLLALFRTHFNAPPSLITRAPGRVNLIGEHTDYNDGFVLPMAISRQTMVAIRPRNDMMVQLVAGDLDYAHAVFRLDEQVTPDTVQGWTNYVRGMAAILQEQGVGLTGADIAILGDMPQGAGLSSSAALENAVGLALAAIAGQPDIDRTRLAQIGQLAEHRFAGCQCGIMDQLVSARAEAGAALLIDCRSLEATPVPLADDLAVMIIHSGISRELVDGAYNSRRMQCEQVATHFGLVALRDLEMKTLEAGLSNLHPVAARRARHVVSENTRTRTAADALARSDLPQLGALMAASHASMRDDFEITTPAIDGLVALLQVAIGADGGARMTGGGFGGAVVAIMARERLSHVRNAVDTSYRTPLGAPPLIMIETPCHGASII